MASGWLKLLLLKEEKKWKKDFRVDLVQMKYELEELEGDLKGLSARLNNPKFVASAPEEVVAETRDAQTATLQEADKLRNALARLATAG